MFDFITSICGLYCRLVLLFLTNFVCFYQLEDRFNVSLDLSQEGRCLLFGPPLTVSKAKSVIMDLVADVEEGGVYEGTVIELKDYGAVIELLRNKEGLLHVR